MDRYTRRVRICSCIPLIFFELLFPLILVGIISYFSQHLMGGNDSDELNQLLSSDTNDRCAVFDAQSLSEGMKEYHEMVLSHGCAHMPRNNTFPGPMTIHLLMKDHSHLAQAFSKTFEEQLELLLCANDDETGIKLRLLTTATTEEINAILFPSDPSQVHTVIDIKDFSSNTFQYDIIVPMLDESHFREKVSKFLLKSFFLKHQHPSEQSVEISKCDLIEFNFFLSFQFRFIFRKTFLHLPW